MTDALSDGNTSAHLNRRHRAEWRFQAYGLSAVLLAVAFLGWLFVSILSGGAGAFQQTVIALDIHFDAAVIDPEGTRTHEALSGADFQGLVKSSLRTEFPTVTQRRPRGQLNGLVSHGAGFALRGKVLDDPGLVGQTLTVWLPASDDVDRVFKGSVLVDVPEEERRITDRQLGWIGDLEAKGRLKKRFNLSFFTNGDSREPELAGVLGALVGTFLSLLMALALSFPLGVLTAIYLEEYAPRNFWTRLIEININNLAAVPSIVFGLLGLAVFLNLFGLPRSAPLVGGMVLALMSLPTIIIASRASLAAVPPSIREAALALGASPVQTVFHHVVPLALPGMMTGTIIGAARALGETAPLLMIGMVAFVVDVPRSFLEPATALPVQIFLWADSPERAFAEKTSAAIIVLLFFLVIMNLTAVILRKKFEHRW
jgi:phosphate transport system permease protein